MEYVRPMFSQKHYEELAGKLEEYEIPYEQRKIIVSFLVRVFEDDNERFNVDKFLIFSGVAR